MSMAADEPKVPLGERRLRPLPQLIFSSRWLQLPLYLGIERVSLLIFEHGYAAMSLRQLAAEVGIQSGSLYNHISTKQELLFDLVRDHINELLRQLDRALLHIFRALPPEKQLALLSLFN